MLELNPRLDEAYYTRGLVREYQGDHVQAAMDYARALHPSRYLELQRQRAPRYFRQAMERLEITVKKAAGMGTRSSSSRSNATDREDELTKFEPEPEGVAGSFADFGGECRAKQKLRELCVLFRHADTVSARGADLPRGVLLHGEPGVGKTYMARIFAAQVEAAFYVVRPSEIFSMWLGQSERNMQKLFDQAAEHPRAVVFFDEIDAIATARGLTSSDTRAERRVLSNLLQAMDGFSDRHASVMVFAATNDLEAVDTACLRPGRFHYVLRVDKPDRAALAEIYRVHIEAVRRRAEVSNLARRIDVRRLAVETEGLVGDDVRCVVREAVNGAILRELKTRAPVARDDGGPAAHAGGAPGAQGTPGPGDGAARVRAPGVVVRGSARGERPFGSVQTLGLTRRGSAGRAVGRAGSRTRRSGAAPVGGDRACHVGAHPVLPYTVPEFDARTRPVNGGDHGRGETR